MKLRYELKLLPDLSGPAGLLVAVIATATKDALDGSGENRADAWHYFAGPVYRKHCELLGLAPSVLPERILELAEEQRTR